MRALLAVIVALLGFAPVANATLIASFSQNPSQTPTVNATDNGSQTTINISDASAAITTFQNGPVGNALLTFNATSTDAVTTLGNAIIQHYAGNFCFSSVASCGGINYLSGNFTDAAFGAGGGPGLVVNVNNPPDTLTMTSDVIPANDLVAPSAFNITFANLAPLLHVNGTTIGAFTAGFAGNVSANTTSIPEPSTLAMFGIGLLGLTFAARRRA